MAYHLIIERYQVYRADGDPNETDGQKQLVDILSDESKWRFVGRKIRYTSKVSAEKADEGASKQVEVGITSDPPVE